MLERNPPGHTRLVSRAFTRRAVAEPEPEPGPFTVISDIREANTELTETVHDLIDRKCERPGDDLITDLISARHKDDVLPRTNSSRRSCVPEARAALPRASW